MLTPHIYEGYSHLTVDSAGSAWQNWAGNQRAVAASVARRTSSEGVLAAVRAAAAAGQTIKPIGSGHSFTGFTSPRRVRFVEMEYGLPRAAVPEALAALRRMIGTLPIKVALPVEVRFTAADDIWLSHGYGAITATCHPPAQGHAVWRRS